MNYKSTIISLIFGGLFIGSIVMATLNHSKPIETNPINKKEKSIPYELSESFQKSKTRIIIKCANEKVKLDNLFQPLFDNTLSARERKNAIDALKEAYPDYLGGLKNKDFQIGKVESLRNALNAQLIQNIVNEERDIAKAELLQKQMLLEIEINRRIANGEK